MDPIFLIDYGRITVRLDYPEVLPHARFFTNILSLAVHTGEIGTFICFHKYLQQVWNINQKFRRLGLVMMNS